MPCVRPSPNPHCVTFVDEINANPYELADRLLVRDELDLTEEAMHLAYVHGASAIQVAGVIG